MKTCDCNPHGKTAAYSFLAGTLVGTLAGMTVVLLLAPRARRESAELIGEFSRDLKDRASATLDKARDKVSSVVAKGQGFLDEKRSVVESAVEVGKEAFEQERNRVVRGS